MIKLNFGCGDEILEGWKNYDLYSSDERVLNVDLNVLPLPFEDGVADIIRVSQVLEHLTCHPFEFIQECYRILRPGGELFIGLPSFSFMLPHLRGYHPESYMNAVIDGGYGSIENYHSRAMFHLVKCETHFSFKRFLRRVWELTRSMGFEKVEWTMIKDENTVKK